MPSRSKQTFVALIRGINVGGKNTVRMEALREVLVRAGFHDVATFIQSGNVVFVSGRRGAASLRDLFVEILEREFSVRTEVVVIPAEAYRAIVLHFPKHFRREGWKHDVFFLESDEEAESIAKEFGGREEGLAVSPFGQAVYWSRDREDGAADKYIRKLLAHTAYKRMTIRNDRTTRKLLDLLPK